MIFGECPQEGCGTSWSFGWDEKQIGYACTLCRGCEQPMWVEFSRFGVTRTHELFLAEVAEKDDRDSHGVDFANRMRDGAVRERFFLDDLGAVEDEE